MNKNQKLAIKLYNEYKRRKKPCPACVVLAADSDGTNFKQSDIKRIKALYES